MFPLDAQLPWGSRLTPGPVGVICDVVSCDERRLLLRGVGRVALTDGDSRAARVEVVSDAQEDASLLQPMAAEILTLLARQLQLIGRAGRAIFRDEFGQLPETATSIRDFEKFSFWVCACLDTRGNWPLLLATRSTLERLRLVRGLMRNAGAHVVLAMATDRSWLRLRSGVAGILGLVLLLVALWWRGATTQIAGQL